MQLKNIRFSLKFAQGGNNYVQVRSIDDLPGKMNLDDLYEYYESGQLQRWLMVQGEQKKAEAVSKINREANVDAQIRALFSALDFQISEEEQKAMIDSYFFPEQIKADRLCLKNELEKINSVISRDFVNYTKTLKEIISAAEDFTAVKAKVRGLLKTYPEQFKLDFIRFYDVMARLCPLAIFTVLMDDECRKYYLPKDEDINANFFGALVDMFSEFPEESPATAMKSRTDKFFSATRYNNKVTVRIDQQQYSEDSYLLKDRLIIKEVDYSQSEGEWQDAVNKGTPVMILHCGKNITIRANDDKEHQFKGSELKEKFMIFDGLDFRTPSTFSPSDDTMLLYMEVK